LKVLERARWGEQDETVSFRANATSGKLILVLRNSKNLERRTAKGGGRRSTRKSGDWLIFPSKKHNQT